MTKKILTAYDPLDPENKSRDHIVVTVNNTIPVFTGLRTGKTHELGMVIFIGKEITRHDIFAKMVDQKFKILNIDFAMKAIDSYLDQLCEFKIGNIIKLEPCSDGFKLLKIAEMPRIQVKKLP